MAKELGGKKIRVNNIAPGTTVTEGLDTLGLPEEFKTQMIAGTPLSRLGTPEDIAKVAVFLASDDAAWVTGERITVSGGFN
jgi:3-oxoacyl-[acyl-carrier protein] reductase